MSPAKSQSKASNGTTRKKTAQFLHNPNCTTCRKAKKFMERRGYQLYYRDLVKDRLSATELEKLIGEHDYKEFLNPRNEVYRKENMKEEPPTRKQAIRLMAKWPNLIRRPVIRAGRRVLLGFDKKEITKL